VGLLSYRAATLDDVPVLVDWHADPEVSRYWDDETFTADELRDRLEREAVDAWLVEEDGEPVGYLQSWWEEAGVGSTEPVRSEGAGFAGAGRRGGLDGWCRRRGGAGSCPRSRGCWPSGCSRRAGSTSPSTRTRGTTA
jgi:hypothetical protein